MEDDRNRLMSPLKNGWNLILEGILEQNEDAKLLSEDHQAIHDSLDELNRNLHQLSQYRHQLNRRLETIKKDVDNLQIRSLKADGSERASIDQLILKLEEEGYSLQLELEELEHRLKTIRTIERNKKPDLSGHSA